jgi:hypothetical protein
MIVFDLDPGAPANILQCCQVAFCLRQYWKNITTEFSKDFRSKGLQVYIPLNSFATYEQTNRLRTHWRNDWNGNIRNLWSQRMGKRLRRKGLRRLEPRMTRSKRLRYACIPFARRKSRRFDAIGVGRGQVCPAEEGCGLSELYVGRGAQASGEIRGSIRTGLEIKQKVRTLPRKRSSNRTNRHRGFTPIRCRERGA